MRLLAALVMGLAVMALPGCNSLPGSDGGKVVLRLATWGGAEESDSEVGQTVRKLWRQFEKENPGVEIREEKIPGSKDYVAKMLLSFVAGTEPDIMSLDASSAAAFIENGVLADLQPFVRKDAEFDLNDYYPNVVQIAMRGEALYAIPGDFTPMVVYYNKKLFDEAGVPYPEDDWTYDDFIDKAKKLSDPAKQRWGFKFDNWMPGWIVWIWNYGGDVLSPDGTRSDGYLNGEKTVGAVKFLHDMINVHKAAPSLSQVAALGVNPFHSGKAAMMVAGRWEIPGLKVAKDIRFDDIAVAPWPSNLGQPQTVMYEAGFSMSRRCKHPELAWRLIKFLTSKKYQTEYQKVGFGISARRDVAEERAKADAIERKFLEIVPTAKGPWGAKVEGYDYVETEGPKMMDRVLAGGDPKRELDEAVRRIDGYFKMR